MSLTSLLALSAALLVLAATPGPGVFAALARALASGMGPALAVIAGIILGDLAYLLLAIYGLTALATGLGDMFIVVRIAGGLYLIWLGYRLWTAPPRPLDAVEPNRRRGRDTLSGLVITLGNPKVILFYAGFLPTFIDPAALSTLDTTLVAGTVVLVIGGTLITYCALAARARRLLRSPEALRRLNRGAGAMMIGAGAVVASR